MISFEEFWNGSTDAKPQLTGSPPETSALIIATQNTLSTGVSSIVIGSLALSGGSNEGSQVDQFCNEVTQYATSSEVISELSNDLGEPKQDETEDEFVERASNTLRELLRKKFNV